MKNHWKKNWNENRSIRFNCSHHLWCCLMILVSNLKRSFNHLIFLPVFRRRSVSHAQLMHDKGRSLQEFKRRTWLQELLEEVHTADEQAPPVQSRTPSQTFSGNSLHQKPPGASKNLPDRFRLDKEGPNLPQETNKDQAYKDQPLKVATKRKKKVRLGRRRENDKRRRRARSVTITTKEPWRTQYPGWETPTSLYMVLH